MMDSFLKWLITSSENPEQVSMTIRGVLLGFVASILYFANLAGWPLAETDVVQIINIFTAVCAFVLIIVGMARKLILTATKKAGKAKTKAKKKS